MATIPDWITAVGTMLALFAAVVAVLLQARELREQRAELTRQADNQERLFAAGQMHGHLALHLQLIQLAFNDEDLRKSFGRLRGGFDSESWRRGGYLRIWFQLQRSGYLLGYLSDEEISYDMETMWFDDPFAMAWWRAESYTWKMRAANSPGGNDDFWELVEAAYQRKLIHWQGDPEFERLVRSAERYASRRDES